MSPADGHAADPAVRVDEIERERRRLGRALLSQSERLAGELAADSHLPMRVREAFDRAAHTSTPALAAWIAGGDTDVARAAGKRTTAAFGALAARLDAPLPLVLKRVLVWRDHLEAELARQASRLASPPPALENALSMLRRSADVSLVGIAKAFERERQRAAWKLDNQRDQLEHQATRDALTGLANRDLVLQRLQMSLAAGRGTAVVVLDLDNFRYVNDGYGHQVGDHLLREVADRLAGLIDPPNTIGRLGGDEFVVVLQHATPTPMDDVVAALRDAISVPALEAIGPGPGLRVTASVGIAASSSVTATELIRRAEIAMYVAKTRGRDQVVTYEAQMDAEALARLDTEQALRIAVDRDEFVVWYQPVFDLADMSVVGAEALLRWQHPTRGLVGPAEFVPMLEHTGLIVDVGRQALRRACVDCSVLRSFGHDVGVTVNVSPIQLRDTDFGNDLLQILCDADLPTSAITIEITEAEAIANADEVGVILQMLRDTGVRVALDDFGTGYSSLAQLRSLPIDVLKIDKSFVAGMLVDPNGDAFIQAISALARAMSVTTIAEGVESAPQLESLRSHDYTYAQGYFLAAPMDRDAFRNLLATGRSRSARPSDVAGS